jgi:hypothetical protein
MFEEALHMKLFCQTFTKTASAPPIKQKPIRAKRALRNRSGTILFLQLLCFENRLKDDLFASRHSRNVVINESQTCHASSVGSKLGSQVPCVDHRIRMTTAAAASP